LHDHRIDEADEWSEGLNTMLPAFLAGANFVMHTAGWLESGLVSCYEKFVVDLEIVLLDDLEIVERRLRIHDFGLACQSIELGDDVVAASHPEIDLVTGGEPELVDAVDVAGVGNRDAKAIPDERDRDRYDALQRPQGNEFRRTGRDPLFLEIDEGQSVPAGQRSSDAVRLSVALVAERLGERPGAGPPPRRCETVAWNELRGRDEIGDEVCNRLESG